MLVRKATLKDIPETSKMGYELNRHHEKFDPYFVQSKNAMNVYKKLDKKALKSPKSLFLVAEENEKIVGYAIAKIDKRPDVYGIRKIGFINSVYVKKECRRLGISKMFMKQIIDWFKRKKIKYIELHVHSKNKIAQNAYAKYGFKPFLITQRMKIR